MRMGELTPVSVHRASSMPSGRLGCDRAHEARRMGAPQEGHWEGRPRKSQREAMCPIGRDQSSSRPAMEPGVP